MKRKFLAVIISAVMVIAPVAGYNVNASESSVLEDKIELTASDITSDEDKGILGQVQDETVYESSSEASSSSEILSGDDSSSVTELSSQDNELSSETDDAAENDGQTAETTADESVSETNADDSQVLGDDVAEEKETESSKAEETVNESESSPAEETAGESDALGDEETVNESDALGNEETVNGSDNAASEDAGQEAAESQETGADAQEADSDAAQGESEKASSEAEETQTVSAEEAGTHDSENENTEEAEASMKEANADNSDTFTGEVEGKTETSAKQAMETVQTINLPNRYVLRSVAKSSLAIEIDQGQRTEGANAQLGTNEKYNRQSFVFESTDSADVFKIKNTGTGLYLAIKEDNLVQDSIGSDFHVSKEKKNDKIVYTFKEADSGKVISVDGSAKNGANVVISDDGGENTQLWYVSRNDKTAGLETSGEDALLDNGYYHISLTDDDNLRMAVKNAGIKDGVNVQIDTNYADDGEYWYIKSTGDGLYTIEAFCSDMVLTLESDTVESMMNVYQSEYEGGINQKWYIRKSSVQEGAYVICAASDPDFVIGSYGSGIKNGSNIRMYISSKAANRRWNIESVTSPKEDALANGTYYFLSRLTYRRVLSVKDGSEKNNANVQLSLKKDTDDERWTIKSLGYGNLYKVTNYNSGRSLAAKSSSSGANVLQKTYKNIETMTWRIMPTKSGSTVYYRIISVSNDQAVIVKGNNKKSGTNILLGKQSSAKGQQWEAEKAVSSPAKYTDICLTVNQDRSLLVSMITGSSSDNKRLIIDDGTKKELTKTFYISPVARDVYKIECVGSGKYLSVYKSKTSNNAAVVQEAWKSLDSQKWTIEKYGSGYRFKNVGSGKYLTIKNSKYKSGTHLVIYSAQSNKSQTFNWKKASPVTSGWTTINDHRAYVKNGVIQTKKFIDSGKYYVDSNGYIYTGWKKYGRYYYYYKGSSGYVNDTRPYLNKLFGTKTSKYGEYTCPDCEYYITVDTGYPCMATVYTTYPGTNYSNLPVFAFLVSPGKDSTPTDAGLRKTGGNQRWKALMGPSWGQYSTEALLYTKVGSTMNWYCNGEYFHSVACSSQNTHNLNPGTYNLLGTQQSHGCIRCPVRYSYWVYEFVTNGSDMYVGKNLARPIAHVPIPAATGNIDPTDPNYTGNWGYKDSNEYVSGYWSGYIAR